MPKFRRWDYVSLLFAMQAEHNHSVRDYRANVLYLVTQGVHGNNNMMVMLTSQILRDIRQIIQSHTTTTWLSLR